MRWLSRNQRAQVVRCLVEGNSIRSTERITGITKKAISELLLDMGEVCREYQDRTLRNLTCKRLQLDEVWSFCYAKEKNVPTEKKGRLGYGDVWTWTVIGADTKLIRRCASHPEWNRVYRTTFGTLEEVVSLLEAREIPQKCGPYKKKRAS